MERKKMVKSKGKWVVLSSSILASAVALNMATPVAFAEVTTTDTEVASVTEPTETVEVESDDAPEVTENTGNLLPDDVIEELIEVDELVESIVDEVVAQDEALTESDQKYPTDAELEIGAELAKDVLQEAEASPEVQVEEPIELETAAAPMLMRMTATDTNYSINYGDTLWSIANRHGVTVAQ